MTVKTAAPLTAEDASSLMAARRLFTIDEARATLGGLSRESFYQMFLRNGRLPVIRFGRRVLISAAAIDALIAGAGESWDGGAA